MPCSVANTFVDENGLLFLPAAGSRSGGKVESAALAARYYHRDRCLFQGVPSHCFNFAALATSLTPTGYAMRYWGCSVRLVCLAQ